MKKAKHFIIVFVLVIISTLFLRWVFSWLFANPTAASVEAGSIDTMSNAHYWMISLLFSLIMAFPALINIALLLFLVMFIFSVFGMTLFKNVKIRPGFDDVHNFQTFMKTFTLLFQVIMKYIPPVMHVNLYRKAHPMKHVENGPIALHHLCVYPF